MPINPFGSHWERFAEQIQAATESNRKAMEAISRSGLLATQAAITTSLRDMTAGADFASAIQRQLADIERSFGAAKAQPDAFAESLSRITIGLDTAEWAKVGEYLRRVRIEVIDDPELALDEVTEPIVPELEFDTLDGVASVPFIVSRLSPSRRRELVLRLLALVIATSLYIEALKANHDEFARLACALLATLSLYWQVLSAIEDVEHQLREENEK